jgi:filamentous hemagglutinin
MNVDANNRQLHPSEIQRIESLAADKAQQACRGNSDCVKQTKLYWTDMLERAAEGRVDTQEDKKNQAYYNQVIGASGKPGSEAAMGMGARFFDDLGEAQRLLNATAGAPILDSQGRQVMGTDGKPQTYFSATQAQRDNPNGNIFPGGSPNNQVSVIPGKERRDESRLERLSTPNGQAVPDTTIEETLFGARLPTKGGAQGVQAAGRAWESSKVLSAGEIAMSNGGNISAQQITRVGTPAGLNAAERNTLSNLDSLSSAQAGAVREHVSNSYFERNGFTSMDGKCGSNCFDGVYIKGDQVIVNEVKPLNADGSIKLSPAQPSGLPTQGTNDWVKDRALALIDTKDPAKVEVGKLILEANRAGKLTTTISGVNSNGMVIVKVKQ